VSRSKPVEGWDPYKDHVVEVVVETEAVQVYELRERPDTNVNAVQIAFTPWGIGITGDLCPGKDNRGVWSRCRYGRDWFIGASSADYLAGKFLEQTWDEDRAREELRWHAKEEDDRKRKAAYNEVAGSFWNNEHELYQEMVDARLDVDDGVPGCGYDEGDVAMLVSLQARLRRHLEGGGA